MILEMKNINKSFGEISVLHNINLHLSAGEVLGLIGPNGSGKSTLMNILAGVYRQDSGEILVDGVELNNHSPSASLKQGVFMLYQQPALVENMSVMENIFLGRYVYKFGFILDTETMHKKTNELLEKVGCTFKANTIVGSLFGITKTDSGDIYVKGKKVQIRSPKDAIREGIGMVTEDRKQSGLVLPMSDLKKEKIQCLRKETILLWKWKNC